MEKVETLVSVINQLQSNDGQVAVRLIGSKENIPLSYSELHREALQLAQGLVAHGLVKGQTVGLFAQSSLEWYIVCLAVVRAGCCLVPIDVQLDAKSLEHVLADSEVRLIFTNRALQTHLKAFSGTCFYLDGNEQDTNHWKKLSAPSTAPLPIIDVSDLALLIYTSGTTGRPKGVPLPHGKIAHSVNSLLAMNLVEPRDRVLVPIPMHHVYPIVVGVFYALSMRLQIILPAEVTGPVLSRAIREGDVSVILGVPRLYSALWTGILNRVKAGGTIRYALFQGLVHLCVFARKWLGLRLGKILLHSLHKQMGGHIRVAASAGSKLDEELAWLLEGIGWRMAIGYGLTETAPVLSFTLPGKGHLDSVGKPVPNVDIRIENGEVVANGPNIFDGYRNLPQKTAEAFTPDGWFRTGDLGFLDSEGYLHILGRASTLIVASGGEKIQPEDVESVYLLHPFIAEIGVLQSDHRLVAIVVPNAEAMRREGHGDIEWSIRRALAQQSRRLASYQRVTDFAMTRDTLPRTRLGKLRRHLLPDVYEQAKSGAQLKGEPTKIEEMAPEDQELLRDSSARAVWDWLCETHPHKHLSLDTSPQLDLAVDSLEWLNITMEIRQRAGVELGQHVFGRVETLRDLLKEVVEAGKLDSNAAEVFPFDHPEKFLNEEQLHRLEPLPALALPLRRVCIQINSLLIKGLFGLSIEGLENVPSTGGPFVICPNHVSHLDAFAVASALGAARLNGLYWGGWHGVVMRNWFNRLISRLGLAIPIDAQNAAVSSLAVGAAVLKHGYNLVWFPEGRRSPEGTLQRLRPGIGLLLEHFQVPVVPVFITGTFEALPTGKFVPHLHRLKVTFGKALTPAELSQLGQGRTTSDRMTDGLYQAIRELGGIRE